MFPLQRIHGSKFHLSVHHLLRLARDRRADAEPTEYQKRYITDGILTYTTLVYTFFRFGSDKYHGINLGLSLLSIAVLVVYSSVVYLRADDSQPDEGKLLGMMGCSSPCLRRLSHGFCQLLHAGIITAGTILYMDLTFVLLVGAKVLHSTG